MIRKVAILAFFIAAPAMAQTDSPWLNWVAENSPHGFDITSDGTIWINISEIGQIDDYAIRAEDLKAARETQNRSPTFWVRGYHKRNQKAPYRESKVRFYLDCKNERLGATTSAFYDADGSLLSRSGTSSSQEIIPGTYGAEYFRLFCLL
mgnify:CR=1 FL=1